MPGVDEFTIALLHERGLISPVQFGANTCHKTRIQMCRKA